MRALALIALTAASLAVISCDDRDSDPTYIPPSEDVQIDPCVSNPESHECRMGEAQQACAESAEPGQCVADYLNGVPPRETAPKPTTPAAQTY
jgi:hypothetical protein